MRENGAVYATADIPHNIHVHSSTLSQDNLRKMQPALANFEGELAEASPVVSIVKGMTFAYTRIRSMDALRALELCSIETSKMVNMDEGWRPSFAASFFYYIDEARSSSDSFKLNCRMIDSAFGEDAATGSGSAGLAAYLAMERVKELPGMRKVKVEIDQGVEMGRPSKIVMELTLSEEGKVERILQSGSAVQVMAGNFV
jgi:predicted PhzF superfamily epimerase YddE/YHI9